MEVTLNRISKRFGAVLANDAIQLSVRSGEVLALLGENGAGKSTLMKILYGFQRPDSGEISIDGAPVHFSAPSEARAAGIGMVFQDFSLVQAMTVADNLMLASARSGWWTGPHSRARKEANRALMAVAPEGRPASRVCDLAVGEQQLVELSRVLESQARLIILDEPTSVLTPPEMERLYARVRAFAAEGRAIILITHKMDDVMACATRVCVLRSGRLMYDAPMASTTRDQLVDHFIGEGGSPDALSPPSKADPLFKVKGLAAERDGERIGPLEFEVAPGEILGVAGVSGNGQQFLSELLAGLAAPAQGGAFLAGVAVNARGRAREKIGYIPEQPKINGVAGDLDLATNLSLKRIGRLPWLDPLKGDPGEAVGTLERFDVRPTNPRLQARSLSGGNLQKLVLARELGAPCELVVACYPTMGLDLGATKRVHRLLLDQASAGASVVWFSEDLDELLAYTHRIAVLTKGCFAGMVRADVADRRKIGLWMAGTS
jgi:ABC-type uncharacterized transport system ATPase subunit